MTCAKSSGVWPIQQYRQKGGAGCVGNINIIKVVQMNISFNLTLQKVANLRLYIAPLQLCTSYFDVSHSLNKTDLLLHN